MRVGLVYDLRDDYRAMGYGEDEVAEFDSPDTIQALDNALAANFCQVERVGHGRALAERLVAGERFDLVFSIAEGLSGRSREAQVPALCELFGQAYALSDPLTMAASLDKAVAKRLVRDAGVATAEFAVIEHADEAMALELPYPLFVKPLAEGTGKGCETAGKVAGADQLRAAAARLIARYAQPVIVESFLPGREFTVGIVGTGAEARVVGVCEIVLLEGADAGVYSLRNKEECETLVTYRLVGDDEAGRAAVSALRAYRALGCRDAGRLDFRSNQAGRPLFMEANPLAGLHPTHSDLPIIAGLAGLSYQRLIGEILASAAARLAAAPRARARL